MPKLRFLIAALAVAFLLGWPLCRRPVALQVMPPLSAALERAKPSYCWHPGMARNASFAIEPGCEYANQTKDMLVTP